MNFFKKKLKFYFFNNDLVNIWYDFLKGNTMTFENNISTINIDEYKIIDNLLDRYLELDFKEKSDFKRLVSSINKIGIINPLIFYRVDDETLELISGRKRIEAIKTLNESKAENEKILNIPVRILSKENDLGSVYLLAFEENTNRRNLSNEAQIESLLFGICCDIYPDFGTSSNFLKDFKIEEIKNTLKEIRNNSENLNKFESKLLNSINLTSKKVNISENEIINSIIKNSLTFSEKRMIRNFGVPVEIIRKSRRSPKTKKILENIDVIIFNKNLDEKEAFFAIKNYVEAILNRKMSDFYKIEGIDDVKDENGYLSIIKKTEREKIKEYGNDLSRACIEFLLNNLKNEELEKSKKRMEKYNFTKKINDIYKSLNAKDKRELIKIIENFEKERNARV